MLSIVVKPLSSIWKFSLEIKCKVNFQRQKKSCSEENNKINFYLIVFFLIRGCSHNWRRMLFVFVFTNFKLNLINLIIQHTYICVCSFWYISKYNHKPRFNIISSIKLLLLHNISTFCISSIQLVYHLNAFLFNFNHKLLSMA